MADEMPGKSSIAKCAKRCGIISGKIQCKPPGFSSPAAILASSLLGASPTEQRSAGLTWVKIAGYVYPALP
jgi:hypothetical protein